MKKSTEEVLRVNLDTTHHTMGAIQYVECDHCGVKPGYPCRTNFSAPSNFIPDFAHIARRMSFYEQQDLLPAVTRRPIVEPNDGLGDLL